MLRLTYRYWYIVLTLVVLGIAAAVYHTRPDNLRYRVYSVAMVNSPSLQQFEQAVNTLQSDKLLPPEASISHYIRHQHMTDLELFPVIDALRDGKPDYIDFARKSNPKDTVMSQMKDRVCIRFTTRACNVHLIPEMEKALLEYLNNDAALQQSYETYLANLREEAAFNHRQTQKLDSLTSVYYYNAGSTAPMSASGNGLNFYGDRRIRLFLNEIYKHQTHLQQTDYRLNLATAPVCMEHHFTLNPKPVMGRMKCTLLFFLLSWIGGCVLAELIDKRKAIYAWLQQ